MTEGELYQATDEPYEEEQYAPDCGAVTPEEECGECEACEEAQAQGELNDIEAGRVPEEPGTTR